MDLRQGEIWRCHFDAPNKRRPVVVLTRDVALRFLRTATVAEVTSTIRGAPSEVRLGPDEGLKRPSVVTLDNVQTVDQRRLRGYVGQLSEQKMGEVCRALAIATGCE